MKFEKKRNEIIRKNIFFERAKWVYRATLTNFSLLNLNEFSKMTIFIRLRARFFRLN